VTQTGAKTQIEDAVQRIADELPEPEEDALLVGVQHDPESKQLQTAYQKID